MFNTTSLFFATIAFVCIVGVLFFAFAVAACIVYAKFFLGVVMLMAFAGSVVGLIQSSQCAIEEIARSR